MEVITTLLNYNVSIDIIGQCGEILFCIQVDYGDIHFCNQS